MSIDKDGLASLSKPRSEMSRPELYDMIDGLQETVMLCAQRLSEREASLASAREALRGLLRGEYESAEPGLCDCVDNHGKPYQSQFLADRIRDAEAVLSALKELR